MIFLCSFQRQGRSDTFATEFDLEAEEYVPLPKGDVHKKKEIVQDVTLHDLDVANARPQVSAEIDRYFQHDLHCTCIPDTSLNPGFTIFISSIDMLSCSRLFHFVYKGLRLLQIIELYRVYY